MEAAGFTKPAARQLVLRLALLQAAERDVAIAELPEAAQSAVRALLGSASGGAWQPHAAITAEGYTLEQALALEP